MAATPVPKKNDTPAAKGDAQAKPGTAQGNQAKPNAAQPQQAKKEEPKKEAPAKKEEPKKEEPKKAPAKKAPVATAPENKAHHATLSETKCADCAVGLLKQHASESLRNQKKHDPENQKYHLQDNEELEFVRTSPLLPQLVGLRRERSLSNKFDDLLVMLYDPALLKEGEKTVLEPEGLRKENLAGAQAYVDAILGAKNPGPPNDWPLPGKDVSCKQCKHWRVMVFPMTTEPGYDKGKHNPKDAQGNQPPDFDNLTLLPNEVGAVAPGIYNAYYRVGLHKGTRSPPTSFAALQLVPDSIPARRRYPVAEYLKSAQAAYDTGKDDDIRKALIKKDAKAQKEARAKIEAELGKTMPTKAPKEKEAFTKAVQTRLDAENLETYKPKIAEYRKNAAKASLNAFKARIGARERIIRLEDPSGAETQNFEQDGSQVSQLEVADDDKSPMKVCAQLVFKAPPPAPPAPATPAPSTPAAATPAPAAVAVPPPARKTLKLTADDILVTFGTAAGTNMHRSEDGEGGSWRRGREVNNWSEGCQVFRSPNDFAHFMRMAMLAKRAHCPSRTAKCGEPLKVEDVEKGIGANMTAYILKCPDEFAEDARKAILAAFTPPSPPPPPPKPPEPTAKPDPKIRAAIEKLLDGSTAAKDFNDRVKTTFLQVFPNKGYNSPDNFELLKKYAREKALGGLTEASVEDDVKKALETSLEDLKKKLTEVKDSWVKDKHSREIGKKHSDFLEQGLEPCDFGNCGFKFDYMLAETSKANMEAFVSKLGDRPWNTLFPDDAPPPPPPPPKQPKAASAPAKDKAPAQPKPAATPGKNAAPAQPKPAVASATPPKK